jgi:hypothetical protein
MLVVDGANVVGARPDGWWRDRAGAARRLVDAIAGAVASGALDPPVAVVLEGAARAGVAAGTVAAGVTVVHAPAVGDDAIVALVERVMAPGPGSPAPPAVRVVTADRALRARVTTLGAGCVGPGWLRDRC